MSGGEYDFAALGRVCAHRAIDGLPEDRSDWHEALMEEAYARGEDRLTGVLTELKATLQQYDTALNAYNEAWGEGPS